MKRINQKTFIILILILCAVGMFLRWRGIWYVAVDYELCFEPWYMQLAEYLKTLDYSVNVTYRDIGRE